MVRLLTRKHFKTNSHTKKGLFTPNQTPILQKLEVLKNVHAAFSKSRLG